MDSSKTSRSTYAMRNVGVNLLLYFTSYIAVFISRTYFIKILGNDYLSISGLFTNIITIISFSELGLGTASIYCLYKPLASHNYNKILSLLRYFRILYRYVIGGTLIISIVLAPFLHIIIDIDSLNISVLDIYLFYCLFVVNTAVSYFLVEYKLLLIADQKNYITGIIQQFVHILQLFFQTIYLIYTKDYLGFLLIQILCTLITNVITSCYVKKLYVGIFSNEPTLLTINEKKELKTNIISIFYYKIGAVILNGTDNIIISTFIKTSLVGICSNYLMLINSVNSVIMQCINGIGASIGNHIVKTSNSEQYLVFKELDFLCSSIFLIASICLASLLNPFILIWIGTDYLLDEFTVYSIVLAFYVTGVNQVPSLYRTSFGFFKNARFYPIIASFLNIILSIVLAKTIGLCGIFIGTIITRLLFFTIVDSMLVFRKGFKVSIIQYYLPFLYRLLILSISIITIQVFFDISSSTSNLSFIKAAIIIALYAISIVFLCNCLNSSLWHLLRRLIKKYDTKNK